MNFHYGIGSVAKVRSFSNISLWVLTDTRNRVWYGIELTHLNLHSFKLPSTNPQTDKQSNQIKEHQQGQGQGQQQGQQQGQGQQRGHQQG